MNREHLESMRWLYDSEESYKKAVRAILAEEVKEKRRALLKKKLRQARFQKKVRTYTAPFKKLRINSRRAKLLSVSAKGLFKKATATRVRIAISSSVVLVLMIVGVLGFSMFASRHKSSQDGQGGNGIAGATTTAPEAPFDPVILSDKAAKPEDYRYDTAKQLLTYSATISGVKATISQQPFPDEFIKDTVKFEAFLDSIPEKQTIPLSTGTAYISILKEEANAESILSGNSGEQAQYAVYMSPKFLVFIRSEKPLDKEKWQDYFKYLTLN